MPSPDRPLRVLITDFDFPDVELERAIFAAAGIEMVLAQCKTAAEVIEAARGAFGLLVQYAPIDAALYAARPEVRIVSRYGAGYDTVDLDAAREAGVWVANSPDYGVGEVATHAFALVLALLRHIDLYASAVRRGTWHYLSPGRLSRVSNMTLGIVGLGRIGKRMAHLARNTFGRVIACDPYLIDGDFPSYVERVSLQDLFARSHAVSLHVPLNASTRGMVSADLLERMPKGAVLVNTARGALVDVDALVAALDAGRLDGAGLDVLPNEPGRPNWPVVEHPRVICTPHAAFYSVEAEHELRRKAAENLVQYATLGRPAYVVVAPASMESRAWQPS